MIKIRFLCLSFVFLFVCAEAREDRTLASLCPENTPLYISFPSLNQAWSGFQTLPLYQAYKDEEVQIFIESFSKGLEEVVSEINITQIRKLLTIADVFDHEASFALSPPEKRNGEWDFLILLRAKGDIKKAEAYFKDTLLEVLKCLFPYGPVEEEIGGAKTMVFKGIVTNLYLRMTQGELLITRTKEKMLLALDESKTSLLQEKNFKQAKAALDKENPSFLLYFNPAYFQELASHEMDKKERLVLRESGFDSMNFIATSICMEKGRAKEMIHVNLNENPKGFFDMFSNFTVDPELARLAPNSTLVLAGGNINFTQFYDTILAMEQASPKGELRNFRRSADELAEGLGLHGFSDLIGQLGTEAAAYIALPNEGGLIPELVIALEALKPDKLLNNLDSLVTTFLKTPPKKFKFKNREIHYAPMIRNGFFELSVCWCMTDGYLFTSLHPSAIKGLIRRLDSNTNCLSQDPAFEKAWSKMPKEAVALAYADTKRIFNYLYGKILPITVLTQDDLPFDSALMPSAEAVSAYLSFGLSGMVRDEAGFWVRTESDGYGPTSLMLYGYIAAAMFMPYDELSRSLTRYPACGDTQKRIHETVEEYRHQNGAYPKSLEELPQHDEVAHWRWTCRQACIGRTADQYKAGPVYVDFGYIGRDQTEAFEDHLMVLWDSKPRHNNGRIILLGSKKLIWLPEDAFQKRLEEQSK